MAFNRLIITYSENTKKLEKEMKEAFPERVKIADNGDIYFDIIKTQTVRKNNLTLSAILVQSPSDYQMLDGLEHLTVLGSYEKIFKTPSLLKVYKKVYDFTKATKAVDENGIKYEWFPPKKFCDIA